MVFMRATIAQSAELKRGDLRKNRAVISYAQHVHNLYTLRMYTRTAPNPAFRQLFQDDPALSEALEVMRTAFAGMEGRIDPPSSLKSMNLESVNRAAGEAEVWAAGDPVVGTVTLTPKGSVLYVGKLAVLDPRQGLGRALMALAEERAVALGFKWLELQSRVELEEIHAVFKRLGFREVMRTTHEGYVRPTSVLFRKAVG